MPRGKKTDKQGKEPSSKPGRKRKETQAGLSGNIFEGQEEKATPAEQQGLEVNGEGQALSEEQVASDEGVASQKERVSPEEVSQEEQVRAEGKEVAVPSEEQAAVGEEEATPKEEASTVEEEVVQEEQPPVIEKKVAPPGEVALAEEQMPSGEEVASPEEQALVVEGEAVTEGKVLAVEGEVVVHSEEQAPSGEEVTPPEEQVLVIEKGVAPPSGEQAPVSEVEIESEEKVEPIEEVCVPALKEGEVLTDPKGDAEYKVLRNLNLKERWRIAYNIYEVEVREKEAPQVNEKQPTINWLWEATSSSDVEKLKKEAQVLEKINSQMFPKLYRQFAHNDRFYILTEPLKETATLAEEMDKMDLLRFLRLLSQVAYALSALHSAGWLHLALRPEYIILDKPIKIIGLSWSLPLKSKVEVAIDIDGYSPPEFLRLNEELDERADVYYIGALLYRFLKKQAPISFSNEDLQVPFSGLPQFLSRCLASKEERYWNMQALHNALLRLVRRYSPLPSYSVAGATTIGLELGRSTNQDAYGYMQVIKESENGPSQLLVACVSDGMGGMQAGEVASEIAVNSVLSSASKLLDMEQLPPSENWDNLLKEWFSLANERICSALEKRRAKGGCTLLCCLLQGKSLSFAHIGDCRLYLFRENAAQLLTTDHSLAAAMAMQNGQYDPDALRHHPDRSMLTRSLGDRLPLPSYFVDTGRQELKDGDVLLLCSDGVWEPLSLQEMLEIINQNEDLNSAVQRILEKVLERGAPDNATVLIIKVKEQQPIYTFKISEKGGEGNVEYSD